jgi:hypothetical protein
MFFEPMWVFTNDADLASAKLEAMPGKRISIGLVGSRTNAAARTLFSQLGVDDSQVTFLSHNPADAAAQLKSGEIAGAIMVTNATTLVMKDLLASSNISLVNFRRANAYAALFPELKKRTVPAVVGDLARNLPPDDVNIFGFTAILVVRDSLYPAIQSLLLDAASQIHAAPDLFHADGRFPAASFFDLPPSPSASRYYTSGQPFLQRYLPFWLAVLVMQILVAALPLVGLVYPALKVMPAAYDWAMKRRIFRLYGELRRLESHMATEPSGENKEKALDDLDDLERRVRTLRVPVTFSNLAYGLRTHINIVRSRISANR